MQVAIGHDQIKGFLLKLTCPSFRVAIIPQYHRYDLIRDINSKFLIESTTLCPLRDDFVRLLDGCLSTLTEEELVNLVALGKVLQEQVGVRSDKGNVLVLFLDDLHAFNEMHEGEVEEGLVGRGFLELR